MKNFWKKMSWTDKLVWILAVASATLLILHFAQMLSKDRPEPEKTETATPAPEDKCTSIPDTDFYKRLRAKTLKNFNKKFSRYSIEKQAQLLENARQKLLVSKLILEMGCAGVEWDVKGDK